MESWKKFGIGGTDFQILPVRPETCGVKLAKNPSGLADPTPARAGSEVVAR